MRKAQLRTVPLDVSASCLSFVRKNAKLRVRDISADALAHVADSLRKTGIDEVYEAARQSLMDPERSYAYLDLSLDGCQTQAERTLVAVMLAGIIFRELATPIVDMRNGTPFNLYKSSADRASAMRNAGIHFYEPDEKIGFHNDAVVGQGTLGLAHIVGLVNLFIGYRSPGNFLWIPIEAWVERKRWMDEFGEDAQATVETTPIVYESDLEEKKPGVDGLYQAALFPSVPHVGRGLFMNGTIRQVRNAAGAVVHDGEQRLQQSLMRDPGRIALPQATGRLVLLRNDAGVHSRDIFTGQTIFRGVTRLLLRIMSRGVTVVGQQMEPQPHDPHGRLEPHP